ncbi:MAG: nitroreductase family deazaflavin-dependent oxidoreductase [Acidimicrobiia bacterium]|nr:nitroreductase family deazaflavin-dependent oxidoreductase [Acidimicrobiia bacterium]
MELTESQEARLRRAFRILNRHMLLMWRLGLGWQMANPLSGYIMVLATTGRKSGERRLVPLNFAEGTDAVYCLAGFGRTTHWLLNLQADPQCEIWLPDRRRLRGRAELVTTESRRISLVREILVRSGFAAKVAEPSLDLATAPNEAIAELGPGPGRRYEVVEINLGDAITGPGGPGDLTWVWPTAVVSGLGAWMVARRCRADERNS